MSKITLISIDFETTGLNPSKDQIIEIGAVKFNQLGQIIDTFQMLAKPSVAIQEGAKNVHGLTEDMLIDCISPRLAWEQFLVWSGDVTVYIAHNAKFEALFIQSLYLDNAELPDISFICTLEVSKKRLAGEPSHKLDRLVSRVGLHRALPDAQACIELYMKISETYKTKKLPIKTYSKNINYFKNYDEPSRKQLSYIASLGGDGSNIKTLQEASNLIDDLLSNKHIESSKHKSTRSASGLDKKEEFTNSIMGPIIIFLFIIVIIFIYVSN